ncbi:Protein involved in biosynthesis of mitomycin antibiotics/polyketide fumonisin [Paraburkholderia caribensis MBA4]|uniref:Protein involved in biosynthesis of mitomycin antibiotics/polyketide fumonisin n=1 Tax=Paraburkholderia caribensis MBA4 TaxID=1323664 RepID=A0A0P0RIB4_9BURK|nr:phytanoyl-CoA dioxygenase family protein [Paraburkholderia caribensis]ALL68491.1 Protein involved in biosynthesis of mitomycin antibiotics/polyketide fumonisin [Paraburkholderia caribensis MBA4]
MSDIGIDREQELDAPLVTKFIESGWVLAKGFFSPSETADLQRFTDEVIATPESVGGMMVYGEQSLVDPDVRLIQRIEDICRHHEGFDAVARQGRLLTAVEELAGARAVLFKDKINLKMAGGAGFEAHQDQQAGWGRYAQFFLSALVCVDAASVENGCLQFANGVRCTGLIGDEWTPLAGGLLEQLDFVPVETEPGDVVFFDSYAPHQSASNLTNNQRRLIYLTYNLESAGDWRAAYFDAKRASFPPDIERKPGSEYRFRV